MNQTKVVIALKIKYINDNEIMLDDEKKGKFVPISYKNQVLCLQTPFLEINSDGLMETEYDDLYQFYTLFAGCNKDDIDTWYQFLEKLETRISSQLSNNYKWFTTDTINFKSLIKEYNGVDEHYFYTRWLVDLSQTIFIDEDKNPFDPQNLKKKDLVKLIVEITHLWIHGNQCGLKFTVPKVMVSPAPEKITTEYVFDENESDKHQDNTSGDESDIVSLLATEQNKPISVNVSAPNNVLNQPGCLQLSRGNSNNQANQTNQDKTRSSVKKVAKCSEKTLTKNVNKSSTRSGNKSNTRNSRGSRSSDVNHVAHIAYGVSINPTKVKSNKSSLPYNHTQVQPTSSINLTNSDNFSSEEPENFGPDFENQDFDQEFGQGFVSNGLDNFKTFEPFEPNALANFNGGSLSLSNSNDDINVDDWEDDE